MDRYSHDNEDRDCGMNKATKSNSLQLREQEELFAGAVHEIRTPMTAVHGYSELLASGTVTDDEVRTFSRIIHRNSAYLLQLVDGLLDFTKLRSGKFEVDSQAVELISLCEDVEEICRPKAEEKGIAFGVEYIFPLPSEIESDSTRLKQVLLNLVGNAVKFTREGGVKLVLSFDQDSCVLTFKVVDTGIGLTQGQQEKLFSAFAQADISITQEFGGTGLGLLVSKEILSQLGGALEIDSEFGRGTVFSATLLLDRETLSDLETLTLQRKKLKKASKERVPALMGRVLIVEDDEDTRNLVQHLLVRAGAFVTTAENGQVGLELAQLSSFDLIFLDRNMPLMSGEEVVRKLRDQGYENPIVAFSADQTRETNRWITSLGLSGFLRKPFTHAELYQTAQRYLCSVPQLLESDAPLESYLLAEGEQFRMIVEEFVEGLPGRLQSIRDAIDRNDLDSLIELSHKLCGSTIFGFPILEKVARSLQDAVRSGGRTEIALRFRELDGIIQRVTKGLS